MSCKSKVRRDDVTFSPGMSLPLPSLPLAYSLDLRRVGLFGGLSTIL